MILYQQIATLVVLAGGTAAAQTTDELAQNELAIEASVGPDFVAAALAETLASAWEAAGRPKELLLRSRLGRHSGHWVLDLELVDAEDLPSKRGRHTLMVAGDVNDLLTAIPGAIAQVLERTHRRSPFMWPIAPARPSSPGPEPATVLDFADSDTLEGRQSLVLPLAATGVAVAGVVFGALFASMSQTTIQYGAPELQLKEAFGQGQTPRPANTLAVAANVAFGVAGLAALTGGILLVVDYRTPEDDDSVVASQAAAALIVPF